MLLEKGHNTALVLMMESCITPRVSHCMLSVVITVTDCLLFYMLQNEILSTLRRLVVENHERGKRIVPTVHDSNSNNTDSRSVPLVLCHYIFLLDFIIHVHSF